MQVCTPYRLLSSVPRPPITKHDHRSLQATARPAGWARARRRLASEQRMPDDSAARLLFRVVEKLVAAPVFVIPPRSSPAGLDVGRVLGVVDGVAMAEDGIALDCRRTRPAADNAPSVVALDPVPLDGRRGLVHLAQDEYGALRAVGITCLCRNHPSRLLSTRIPPSTLAWRDCRRSSPPNRGRTRCRTSRSRGSRWPRWTRWNSGCSRRRCPVFAISQPLMAAATKLSHAIPSASLPRRGRPRRPGWTFRGS